MSTEVTDADWVHVRTVLFRLLELPREGVGMVFVLVDTLPNGQQRHRMGAFGMDPESVPAVLAHSFSKAVMLGPTMVRVEGDPPKQE